LAYGRRPAGGRRLPRRPDARRRGRALSPAAAEPLAASARQATPHAPPHRPRPPGRRPRCGRRPGVRRGRSAPRGYAGAALRHLRPLLLLVLALLATQAAAQTAYRLEPLYEGLEKPVSALALTTGEVLLSSLDGRVYLLRGGHV